ncbi:aldehyde dehydrogenase [Exophiala viscosa]|uniref:aldehyde dehydrogenase (NAD(+)) n=1 Tax=Exophiala viscosa TaxID=2486360 RepID=A0AAN6IEG3_9EURO|nr:aldehyde dehydrogenase [Exophiala viscosa]KAI1624126.1 aldehyde dehydrogenase [Exophiala viscosa]
MASSTTSNSEGYEPKHIENRLFINGEFVPSISGKKFDIINPNTEKFAASVYEGGAEDVDVAVEAAKEALPAWSALGAAERGAWLNKLADAIEKNIDEIGYLDAISMGRPYIGDAMAAYAGYFLRYFASKALDVHGESSLNTAGMVNVTFRQPYGVCGAIIPWNMPLLVLICKVGPALAGGNTLVLKTSEKAPLSCLVVARLCKEIGLPKGVLNILSGFGRPCGEAIAKHMDIRKLSFTGSVTTGRAIKKAAADSNLKNVTLELGGKSPLVIFDDADLAKAVPAAAFSILSNSGQACIASSRVYVHANVADTFLEAMKTTMAKIGQPGDATAAGTSRGPQADKMQFDQVMSYMSYAKEQGLDIRLGGNRIGSTGYFIEPTIIANAPEESKVVKEEIFGPVVVINTFTDEADVLKRANDTEYGLYASVFTKDISRAMRFAKALEAGSVGVNCTSPTVAIDMPFGGYKQSGEGRELSKHCLDEWTEVKSVYISL